MNRHIQAAVCLAAEIEKSKRNKKKKKEKKKTTHSDPLLCASLSRKFRLSHHLRKLGHLAVSEEQKFSFMFTLFSVCYTVCIWCQSHTKCTEWPSIINGIFVFSDWKLSSHHTACRSFSRASCTALQMSVDVLVLCHSFSWLTASH